MPERPDVVLFVPDQLRANARCVRAGLDWLVATSDVTPGPRDARGWA